MFAVAGTFHPAEAGGQPGEAGEEPGEREQNFIHHGQTEQRLEENRPGPRERATSSEQ